MSAVLMLLLLSAALTSESIASSSEDSAGLDFTVVFPENIAFYYPRPPQNRILVTALFNGSTVTANSTVVNTTCHLMAGRATTLKYDGNLELKKRASDLAIKISSQQKLTVQAFSLKNKSVQTYLVMPHDKLGTKYFIPPVPIQETTDSVSMAVTERQPFRIIMVNTDKANNVTLEGSSTKTFTLNPHEVLQDLMRADFQVLKAEHPLAVYFGHTCAPRDDCMCGLLYCILPPAKEAKLTYYIPPILARDAEGEALVLLSNDGKTQKKSFDPDKPVVETAGTAIFYRPGLLLNLIPDTDFAACYVINTISEIKNNAVIVVHKDDKDGVHVEAELQDPQWEQLMGTEYFAAKISLSLNKNIIWHASSKMAVYYSGDNGDVMIGTPAPVVSTSPDYQGCVGSPEEIHIGDSAVGWQESIKYCRDQNMELVSFTTAEQRQQITYKISQIKDSSLTEVWIGLRRSSLTGEWYLLNGAQLTSTNWANREPGTAEEGQCAMMSVDNRNFHWRDEDCCTRARPLCYKGPVFIFRL